MMVGFLMEFLLLLSLIRDSYPSAISMTDTRRRLAASGGGEMVWTPCSEQVYSLSLFADNHLFLVLEPLITGESRANCKDSLLLHDGGQQAAGKAIEVVASEDDEVFKADDLLLLKESVKLTDVVKAFRNAETSDFVYDVVDNNCATFILDMMLHLDIPADKRVATYTAERLAKNGHTIQMLRSSQKLDALLQESSIHCRESSDKDLLLVLVEHYIRHHKMCTILAPSPSGGSFPSVHVVHGTEEQESPTSLPHPESSRRVQTGSCTLCYGGAVRDDTVDERDAYVDRSYTTCAVAEELVQQFEIGSEDCTITQISGYAHCGCPELPPINPEISCNFCKNTPTYDIDLNKALPQFPPPETSDNFRYTCFDALNSLRFKPMNLPCEGLLGAQFYCGCPDAPEPEPCTICLDGGDIPDPDRIVLPDGTCQDVIDVLATGAIESCGAFQATAGVYCGCEANLAPDAKFDLPYSDEPCRVCQNYKRKLLPDTSIRFESRGVNLGYAGLTTSCGRIEYDANAFAACNEEFTFSFGAFCACALEEGEVFDECTMCADGNDPSLPFVLYPDSVEVLTCRSAADEIRTWPEGEISDARCNQWKELGYRECGCSTPPEALNDTTVTCDFGCSYEDIPDKFRYNILDDLVCGLAFAMTVHPENAEQCDMAQSMSGFCCEERTTAAPLDGCTFCKGGEEPAFLQNPDDYAFECEANYKDQVWLLKKDDARCGTLQSDNVGDCGCPAAPVPYLPTNGAQSPSGSTTSVVVGQYWTIFYLSAIATALLFFY